MNNMRSSESGYSAFDCTFGQHQANFFKAMDVESSSIKADSEFMTEFTKDIVVIQEASAVHQQMLADLRATDLSKPRNEWMPGDYVFVDNLSPLRIGPPYEQTSSAEAWPIHCSHVIYYGKYRSNV